MISSLLDTIIGAVSPQKAIQRAVAREMLKKIRSDKYAAAKTSRLTGNWAPANASVNDIVGASSAVVRARVRQLVRDFPYFANAIQKTVDYTVGSGIVYQARIENPDGSLNTKLNQKIEDAFAWWADEADISGRLHYYEIDQLTKRQDVESGEFLVVKTRSNDRNRFLPFCLQVYEADWLPTNTGPGRNSDISTKQGNIIDQGVEYNAATGKVAAYHLIDPDAWGKTKRIPAENVIHGFQTLRPGQIRGISPLAPGVLVAHSLREYMETEIDAAKMAAKYLAFIKTATPGAFQASVGAYQDVETEQKLEDLESAIMQYLRPGEEVQIAANPRPGDNFPPFVRLVLLMLSVTTQVPYELLTGDYQGFSYSTARIARNDYAHILRPVAKRQVRQFGMQCLKSFLPEAYMVGRLDLPGYATDPRRFLASEWQPPGMEPLDPLRETRAAVDGIKARVRSPQEVARARGRELEDVYKEIAEARRLAQEYGIQMEPDAAISTATASNPAQVEGEESDED